MYKCETCGASFSSQAELMEHGKAHARANPYKCEGCGATFTSQAQLHEHVHQKHPEAHRH